MTKVSAPYLYRKRGVYYLQKRIPKPLIPQYGRSILQQSLRTGDRAEAVRLYVQVTGKEGNQRFIASTERSVAEVISLSGDKTISAYNRSDALKFRDALVSRGSSQATAKRSLSNVRAIWNYIARWENSSVSGLRVRY